MVNERVVCTLYNKTPKFLVDWSIENCQFPFQCIRFPEQILNGALQFVVSKSIAGECVGGFIIRPLHRFGHCIVDWLNVGRRVEKLRVVFGMLRPVWCVFKFINTEFNGVFVVLFAVQCTAEEHNLFIMHRWTIRLRTCHLLMGNKVSDRAGRRKSANQQQCINGTDNIRKCICTMKFN